jgi:hypothetical protein
MKSELSRVINAMAFGGRDMVLAQILKMETDRGFIVIPVGSVDWLSPWVWHRNSVVSQDANRIRLVLLEALHQKQGAFTRLIDDLKECELIPVVVEPHDRLAHKLHTWGWRHRRIGVGVTAENLWYPRP